MKIKLLYSPLCYHLIENKPIRMFCRAEPTLIPLISLPVLKSHLNRHGFHVDQDDLDIKTYMDNTTKCSESKKVRMSIFDDYKRVKNFLKRGNDQEFEEAAEKILDKTEYKGYDAIGFSLPSEWNIASFGSTLALAKKVKEKTGAMTVVGGSDVVQLMKMFKTEDMLKFIDLIILEHSPASHFLFVDVLKQLEAGTLDHKWHKSTRELKFEDQHGQERPKVIYKGGPVNLTVYNESMLEEDIFPAPDFNGLPLNLYKYSPPITESLWLSRSKILVLPYYAGYGCPNSCAFCGYSAAENGVFRFKSPELIADDLEKISKANKTKFFVFYNTSINPTKEFVSRFISAMKKKDLGLLWSDCATIRNMDKKTLEDLYDCGARRLIYGIESPSPRLLKYVNKGVTVGEISKILKISHEVGIWNEAELICGLPHETENDIRNTCKFIDQHKEYLNHYHLHMFQMRKSKLMLNHKKYGITNIRECENPLIPGKAFDEVKGLKWKEKLNQIKRSHEIITRKIRTLPNYGYSDSDKCFLRLIYLYAHLKSKKEVLEYIKNNSFTTNLNPIQSLTLNRAVCYPKMLFNKIIKKFITLHEG